jgi:sec-independent protein translocase protein TatA
MGLGGLGMWEMMLIFLVVLLLFGAKRLPEIGSSLGKGIREFKGSIREIEREVQAPPTPRESVTSSSSDDAEQDQEQDQEPRTLTTSPDVDRTEGLDAQ